MYIQNKILAVIGARGESKGLPNKNILPCGDMPLIYWSIQAAKKSRYIDFALVSTESVKIAEIAISCGAEVPFLRSPELASDTATIDVAIHEAILKLASNNRIFDYILWLQPTSPLRTSDHIDCAIEQYFLKKRYDDETMVSVYQAGSKSGWLMEEKDKHFIDFCFYKRNLIQQRQALKKYFIPNGAFYFSPIKTFDKSFYTDRTQFFLMDIDDSVDIDDAKDFALADSILRSRNRG